MPCPASESKSAIDAITTALSSGGKVVLPGFGTFEVRSKSATTARNPRTGETVEVPAKKSPAFKKKGGGNAKGRCE